MTRKQAILAALQCRPVTRVPVASYNFHPYGDSPQRRDPSYGDLLTHVERSIGMYCKRLLPVAGVVQSELPEARRQAFDLGPRCVEHTERRGELTIVTTILPTPGGDLRSVRVKPADQPALTTEHFIKTDADIERFLAAPWEPSDYDVEPLRAFADELGAGGVIAVAYADPMYAAARHFDFADFCERYATRPAALHRLIDHLFELIREDTRRKIRACRGMDVIFVSGGPELATPPMMSPQAFAELVVPCQRRLIAQIHDAGHLAMMHCHGRVALVLEHMLATGVDAIEPIEPPPQGDITLADLLRRTDGRLGLLGHIQDQAFHTAPPGTMTRQVEAIARVVDGRSGYVMAPTCAPFRHPATATFLHNWHEWIEAATRAFGWP